MKIKPINPEIISGALLIAFGMNIILEWFKIIKSITEILSGILKLDIYMRWSFDCQLFLIFKLAKLQ